LAAAAVKARMRALHQESGSLVVVTRGANPTLYTDANGTVQSLAPEVPLWPGQCKGGGADMGLQFSCHLVASQQINPWPWDPGT